MKKRIFAFILILSMFFTFSYSGATASFENYNPFAEMDNARDLNLKNFKLKKSVSAPKSELHKSNGKRYLVKFKNDVSMKDIYDVVNSYDYSIIGKSNRRMFAIEVDNINEFRNKTSGMADFIEEQQQRKFEAVPNDARASDQWALDAVKLPDAWDISTGSNTVLVAVIDSGIYRGHPDFANTDILSGWDYQKSSSCNTDNVGHGTNVSGIIGASTNNGIGIAGANWDVAIVPLRISDAVDNIIDEYVISAIMDAADAGCAVINLSLGGPVYSQAEYNAISYAVSKGVIVVAAAGNSGNSQYSYPASYEGVISAAAIDSDLSYTYFSQYNNKVDVAAPGSYILSTNNNGGYSYVDGTSFSSPYVAGIAALAKSVNSGLDSDSFLKIIEDTSTDKGVTGYDVHYGYGVINAFEALKSCSDLTPVTDFTYTVVGNEIEITDYTGAGGDVTIPYQIEGKTVTSIAEKAFYKSDISGVTIPNGITNIGDAAFAGCKKLKSIIVSSGNSVYVDADGVLYNKNKTSLIQYPAGNLSTSYIVPGSVSSIGVFAFEDCTKLQSVQIWNNVTSIASSAFSGVSSLVVIGNPGSYAEQFASENSLLFMPPNVDGLNAKPENFSSVKLSWNAVPGASGYQIQRSTSINGEYNWVGTVSTNSFTNSWLISDKTYYYKVRAFKTDYYGNYTSPISCKVIKTFPTGAAAVSNSYNSIKVSWKAVSGASGYQVFRSTSANGTYSWAGSTTATSFVNSPLTTGKTYYYKVRAYKWGYPNSDFSAAVSAKPVPATVSGLSALRASSTSIKVKWASVSGASGYEIYRATAYGGVYSKIKTTTATYFTNSGLVKNKYYYYKVRAYKTVNGVKVYGAFSIIKSART